MAAVMLVGVTTAPAAEPQVRFTVRGFEISGENPLCVQVTRKALSPYLGEHEGLAGLEQAARALEKVLKEKGYAFHRVVIPPQKLKDGVVTLKITAFRLGQVTVEGNQRFSEENIRNSLPALQEGEALNTLEVARMLEVVNAHPAKKTAVFLRNSPEPKTIDARIQVRDQRPYRVFSSLANTGDAETGRTRLSLGVQHSNLFDRDHALTLSYTTSPEFVRDVTQLGINYRLPVYRIPADISLFYSYSEVDQGRVAEFFDVSGKGNFCGAGIDYTLLPRGIYSHKITFGFQDRLFKNDTLFGGTNIGQDVRSRPVSLRYTGRVEKVKGNGGFYVEFAVNTGSGADNDDAAYGAVRAGAETNWTAVRYGADLDLALPKNWRFRGRLTGQIAGDPLIPGEQFGVGGVRSVRGFEEREVSGDSGRQLSAEVWTPPLIRNIRVVGFLDMGWSRIKNAASDQSADEFLAGTGLGIRWFWKDKLSLSIDAALALDGADTTEAGEGKVHFNLFFRY